MPWTRDQMARRAAEALGDAVYVTVGIRIPALVTNPSPIGVDAALQPRYGMPCVHGRRPIRSQNEPRIEPRGVRAA